MRNICPPKLCNGTRIIVTNLQKNIVVGNILTGVYKGEQVMLPRITLETTDTSVIFKRKQFPIRLCYAMTINKSQGQTFDKCGLLLDTAQCFAHGQLYVACSRVTSHDSLIIYTGYRKQGDYYERKPARNCVYKELFHGRGTKHTATQMEKQGIAKSPEVSKRLSSSDLPIGEEEPDQSVVVIPSINEEEAIKMIMPDEFYRDDYFERAPVEVAEMMFEKLEKREKELKQETEKREKEYKEESAKRENEYKEEIQGLRIALKERDQNQEKHMQLLYKILSSSDKDDSSGALPKKRKL